MKKILLGILFSLYALCAGGQQPDDIRFRQEWLEQMTLEELRLIGAGIYAKHGYAQEEDHVQFYVEGQAWRMPASPSDIDLSETDRHNLSQLRVVEQRKRKMRDAALRELRVIKEAANNNDRAYLDKMFSSILDGEFYEATIDELKVTMNRIDLDRIHWNNGRGLYKVTIDDGYEISGYEIRFEGDKVKLSGGISGHTEIFGSFADLYSDFMSESEYAAIWTFEMSENSLTFMHLSIVG